MTGGALTGMITMLWHAAGLGGAIIWGAAVGLPIRRRIIRKWARGGVACRHGRTS